MIVKSLQQMEKIVSSNRQLSWDGWDVIKRVPTPTAWTSVNGVFYKNKWHLESRFPLTENGWNIPNKLMG